MKNFRISAIIIFVCVAPYRRKRADLCKRSSICAYLSIAPIREKKPTSKEKINAKLLRPGEKIVRITLFGGPIPFAHLRDLKFEAETLLRQIRFGLKEFTQITNIVLVFHDCGYYANVFRHVSKQEKLNDAVKASRFLRRHIAKAKKISAYYDTSAGGKTSFLRCKARCLVRADQTQMPIQTA